MANLKRRKVVVSSTCPCCGRSEESDLHGLWSCKELDPVRADCPAANSIPLAGLSSMCDFIFSCQAQLLQDEFELMLVIWWRIWFRRNKKVHDNLSLCAGAVVP
ncbi:hypothetical protein ACOSQ2_002521 [Xanthoceras sorbifolium]